MESILDKSETDLELEAFSKLLLISENALAERINAGVDKNDQCPKNF